MIERPVIVIGAGGHAKVVIDLLLKLGRTVTVALDKDEPTSARSLLGVPVAGESAAFGYGPDDVDLALGVGMPTDRPIQGLSGRRALTAKFEAGGYRFPALVHPSAIIGADVRLDRGVQIMAGAVVQPSCVVGDFAIVNTRASVDHDCVIGEGCHVGPGATLGGGVRVGADSLVGIGATVRQGVTIGARALIAGGAMVIGDIADDSQGFGVPARGRMS
ncbi:MAG: sugar acetyltransferase [Rhodopseudomonas sp.]|nr:sugar acetyltransferase [Rhodopseudomonas sp.]